MLELQQTIAAFSEKYPNIDIRIINGNYESYVFAIGFHMGMLGTWVAMFVDWGVKSLIYEWHDKNEKWTGFNAI